MPNVWLDCMIQNGDSPATFVAAISGTQMTVSQMITGNVAIGQAIASPGVAPGTRVVGYEDGAGALGTYAVAPGQNAPSASMTASMTLPGRVEALSSIDRLLLGQTPAEQALYLSGAIDRIGVGAIVQLPDGTSWLAALELGRWAGWVKLAVKQIATLSSLDFSKASNSGLAPSV